MQKLIALALVFSVTTPGTTPCSEAKLQELLAPSSASATSVQLDCSVTLEPAAPGAASPRISKQIVIAGADASGLVLDCAGATIAPQVSGVSVLVRSSETSPGVWSRPSDVTIKNCVIEGNIRVTGMATNGEGDALRVSSYVDGHTLRAQQNAPTNIVFDRLTIVGKGGIPLYFSPGVTHSTLSHSEISGTTNSVGIYFDAESAFNTLDSNYIHPSTTKRELVAVDGSAYNTIVRNHFASLEHGGIYLYRNCGEGGTVRHQSPQYNEIHENEFYYKTYDGGNPSVWLGARQGNRDYCDNDNGYPFGSSVDNGDHAINNSVKNNQIHQLPVDRMIRVSDSPNVVSTNITLFPRMGGCSGETQTAAQNWITAGF